MTRHVVNIGLVFCILNLGITGILSFYFPFSIQTTRLHYVSGFIAIILAVIHIMERSGYFSRYITRKTAPISPIYVSAIVAFWILISAISVLNFPPISTISDTSYEERRKAEIFRASSMTASADRDSGVQVIRKSSADRPINIELDIEFGSIGDEFINSSANEPALAVWAETDSGSLIETLHLTESLAFSDRVSWGGSTIPRYLVLPIWRHRYTLVSGIDPLQGVDAMTTATPTHSFSLDSYLSETTLEPGFSIFLEVNAPNDPTADQTTETQYSSLSSVVGQPSTIYAAYVDLNQDREYYLLQLIGHSRGAERSGAINYDLSQIADARNIIERIIVKVSRE